MSDHTPGPWVYGPDAYCPDCAHSVMAPGDLCMVDGDQTDATEADMLLISAAPELYEAAKALLASDTPETYDAAYEALIAAIAKAEGRA